MRPRKRVLLYCADELQLSITRMVLDCVMPRLIVIPFCDRPAKDAVAGGGFHAAVVLETAELDHCEAVVRRIKRADPEISVLLVLRVPAVLRTIAERTLMAPGMLDLREAVRLVATHRKRRRRKAHRDLRPVPSEVSLAAQGSAYGSAAVCQTKGTK